MSFPVIQSVWIHDRKPIKTFVAYSQHKDGSISGFISGKAEAAVTEARNQVLANLTQQGKMPLKQPLDEFWKILRIELTCQMTKTWILIYFIWWSLDLNSDGTEEFDTAIEENQTPPPQVVDISEPTPRKEEKDSDKMPTPDFGPKKVIL